MTKRDFTFVWFTHLLPTLRALAFSTLSKCGAVWAQQNVVSGSENCLEAAEIYVRPRSYII